MQNEDDIPSLLENRPLSDIDYKLCLEAIEETLGRDIVYVPSTFKTYDLCFLAVSINGQCLRYIPKEHRDSALCEQALKECTDIYDEIPTEFKQTCLESVGGIITDKGISTEYDRKLNSYAD